MNSFSSFSYFFVSYRVCVEGRCVFAESVEDVQLALGKAGHDDQRERGGACVAIATATSSTDTRRVVGSRSSCRLATTSAAAAAAAAGALDRGEPIDVEAGRHERLVGLLVDERELIEGAPGCHLVREYVLAKVEHEHAGALLISGCHFLTTAAAAAAAVAALK